jgi:hypothetical protein
MKDLLFGKLDVVLKQGNRVKGKQDHGSALDPPRSDAPWNR